MSLLTFSCSSKAQKQTTDTGMQSDKKILVAYFSCTGTTEKVASAIAQAVNGKLYRITPAVAYTSADLNWNNKASRSSVEMADENSRPALGGGTLNLKDYDVVFLGYPIWWDLCPRPVHFAFPVSPSSSMFAMDALIAALMSAFSISGVIFASSAASCIA